MAYSGTKGNFYNSKKIKYINMLKSGKSKRNSSGEIVKDAVFQKSKKDVAHIESTRRLFNNTKVVSMNELDEYRKAIKTKTAYDVLLTTGNVPYSIINNDVKKKKHSLDGCFEGREMKKPRLMYKSLEEMVQNREKNEKKNNIEEKEEEIKKKDKIKNQTRKTWNELYKVLDSSDIVVHVLDARDPIGTMCNKVEDFINEKGGHKHLIYLLNKVDLIPTSVTAKWLSILSKKHTTLAFHSNSLSNFYGKDNLINILRQIKTLYNKSTVSVGFVGYPNIGKSSVINVLKNKEVCKTAPVPGATTTWQYVTLINNLYMIDSPGVVPISDYKEAVLRGAIHIEGIEMPEKYVEEVINMVKKEIIERSYGINFDGIDEFWKEMSKRYGAIKKKGHVNKDIIAKKVLHDLYRGKIPYYVLPKD